MSLFLKIFLWFWGAMAILALFFVLVLLNRREDPVMTRRGEIFYTLLAHSSNAALIYKFQGEEELELFLQRVERRNGVRAFLFDERDRSLGDDDRNPPPYVRSLAMRARVERAPLFEISTFRILVAQPVIVQSNIYVFCGVLSPSPLLATGISPLFIIVFVGATGAFCYGLARYLAAPVGRIRHAAQRIAAGDLSARVAPNRVRRGNDEIAELARDFDKMADRLDHLVTAQNRLLGDVSHELRSPLARLGLALELARRGDEVKREDAFARIARESERLDELIGELLTLARLEGGLSPRQLAQRVDVAPIAEGVAADADFEAQNAGREVRVVYSGPSEGAFVRGDAELLHRALENVTRNAIRHTGENTDVRLTLSVERSRVVVQIADNGPGVPGESLEAIFDPFFRVEDARERSEFDRGTGLGLSIAQRAARAHGGAIRAFNREEGGLCVEMTLPILSDHDRAKRTEEKNGSD